MKALELNEIITYLVDLQQSICSSLEKLDGQSTFKTDNWTRTEGGGGASKVIENGNVFEKGGVNFSHVYGKLPDILKSETRTANYFHATGVSIVIHPQNPFVPIIHMNVRYFCMSEEENGKITDEWFGGGIDLSPAYPNEDDTLHLHQTLKEVCDKFDISYYPTFKTWCDDYFTIKHRNEMRGVGGIFYDHLRPKNDEHKHQLFSFMQAVGNSFLPIYAEIVQRNKEKSFNEKNKEWQFVRRGRYAEFNLIYDRGTHFGLRSNGRIESILMSLPPHAEWKYNYEPKENSDEAASLLFFQPKNWIN
ncbi:MAG: oxygen-dependent coproporphyrinogen oxidase [Bacteroidetes bacterium]|nr:oxygen-dependent coproporphyrinogen oxidase [Bacteroidota bacterium]